MTVNLQDLGKIIGEVIVDMYIRLAVIAAVFILLIILVVTYISKKKKSNEGADSKKGFVPLRISIIVVIGALVLLTFPMLVGFFL